MIHIESGRLKRPWGFLWAAWTTNDSNELTIRFGFTQRHAEARLWKKMT